MNRIKKSLIRPFLQNKRILKKPSFLLILCLIPLLTLAMSVLARDKSGILSIVICCEDKEDEVAQEVTEKLIDSESVLLFTIAESEAEAREAVITGKADAAWIFDTALGDKIDAYVCAKGKREPLVTVIERETDISLQLSHEKLYGSLSPYISYSVFKNYVSDELFEIGGISEEQIKESYGSADSGGNIVSFERLDGTRIESESNYLTVPLRGLLSLVVVLCGIAAVMYHQSDKEHGVYDMIPPRKHIFSEAAVCGAAVLDATLIAVIALAVSNLFTTAPREILSAICFIPASVCFCMVLGGITKNSARTGQLIPFVIILLLVLSPIFFNLKSLIILQHLLPTYYYLYATYDAAYIIYMLGYSVVMFSLALLLRLKSIRA